MWHYRHGLRQLDQQLGHNEDSHQFPSHMRWSQEWGGLPRPHSGKEPAYQCRRCARCGFDPCVGKIPWSRKWHPTPVFLPEKSHGQRSLEGYSPWGCKELDTAEHQHEHSNSHNSPNSSLRYRISLGDLMWPSSYLHFIFIPVIVLNYL